MGLKMKNYNIIGGSLKNPIFRQAPKDQYIEGIYIGGA